MTFRATSWTLADAKATAVSAMISAWAEPKPPVTDRLMKLSRIMSISSETWPRLPQILAWIEGYISTSSIVNVISLSKMSATFCLLASSECLQKRTKFGSHGVMYSRHKCFSSMVDALNPWMHSSRNSRVKWGSLWPNFSLTDLIKSVLLEGMHNPAVSKSWPSIFKSKVAVRAQSKL